MSEQDDAWACIYAITFSDDGDPEYGVLQVGTEESCAKVMRLVPAISYSGDRPVVSASMHLIPAKLLSPMAGEDR